MDIARLLSQPSRHADHAGHAAVADDASNALLLRSPQASRLTPPQAPAPVALNKAAPVVKKRIRRNRKLTAKQFQSKRDYEAHDSRIYNLTLDTNNLKQQVRDYMVYKSLRETRSLVDRLNYNAGVLRTTQHHFALFQSGFRAWTPQEAAFFRATVGDEIIVIEKPGNLDTVFATWRLYRDMMALRRFAVTRMRVVMSNDEACVIECDCEVEGRVTRELIDSFFSHILANRALLRKVLNAQLVYPSKTVIHFDGAGRMIEYNGGADFFEGFSRIPTLTSIDVLEIISGSIFGTQSCLTSKGTTCIEELNDDDVEAAAAATSGESELDSDAVSVASSSSAATSPDIATSRRPFRSSVAYILS